MGTDARVRYTKKLIHDAFLSLLQEKNVRQITVTELCRLANINRATFYKHYRDAFDLLEQIEAGALEHLRDTARQIQGEDAMGHFVRLLERAREHHEEFAAIASENGDPHFSQRVSACLYEAARDTVLRHLPAGSEAEKTMTCRFLEGGGSGVLDFWLCGGMQQEPEEVAWLIFRLSEAVIRRGFDEGA